MSFETIRRTIQERMNDQFPARHPTVSHFWDNQPFTQPQGAAWVYCCIHDNYIVPAQLNGSRMKTVGVVEFEVRVPEDTGTSTARQITDSLMAIFLDRSISMVGANGSIVLGAAQVKVKGIVHGWYVVHVLFDYQAWAARQS
jgi:hypothetical protein